MKIFRVKQSALAALASLALTACGQDKTPAVAAQAPAPIQVAQANPGDKPPAPEGSFSKKPEGSFGQAASKIRTDGAEPGEWTMDLAAAQEVAKAKKLPMLLNFTGSDWCGACKQVDAAVFHDKGWQAYAKGLMLVTIDYPRFTDTVPEKFKERNESLKVEYGISKFPTFIVFDSDGKTPIGTVDAIPDPARFQDGMEAALKFSAERVATFAAALPDDEKAKYPEAVRKHLAARFALESWMGTMPQDTPENRETLAKYESEIFKYMHLVEDIEVGAFARKLAPEAGKRYQELHREQRQIRTDMTAWIRTQPDPNKPENKEKIKDAQNRTTAIATEVEDIKARHFATTLDKAASESYLKLHEQLKTVQKERHDFLAGDPEHTPENDRKFKDISERIAKLSEQMAAIRGK